MTNTNIQGTIPLAGPGLKYKPTSDYKAGEYSVFKNVDITEDGTIRGRRNFVGTAAVGPNPDAQVKVVTGYSKRIVGEIQRWVIIADQGNGATAQIGYQMNEKQNYDMWSQSSLPTGINKECIVAAFYYNNKAYWLTMNTFASNAYFLYSVNYQTDLNNVTFAQLTKSPQLSGVTGPFKSFFIHKDRLFITTQSGVYFSKATDPTTFATPNGGFILLQGKEINSSFAINDSIYVLSNQGVDVFTYSSDPNTDGYLRNMIPNVRAFDGCSFEGTPFIVTDNGIGILGNGYLDMVVSRPFFNLSGDVQLTAMNDSLVVTDGGPNIVCYNARTNSTSIYTLNHVYDGSGNNYIIDAYTPSPGISYGISSLTMFLSRFNDSVTQDNYLVSSYVMEHDRNESTNNTEGRDQVAKFDGTRGYILPDYQIELRNVKPDGSKFLNKKFRSLHLSGLMPKSNMEIAVSFDNRKLWHTYPLEGSPGNRNTDDDWSLVGPNYPVPADSAPVPPYLHRIPLMQRGKSFNIRIRNSNPGVPITPVPSTPGVTYPWSPTYQGILEIADMDYLWTYVSSPANNRNNFSNP